MSCPPPSLQLANADSTTATFHLYGEDHTLGNSLRYILAKAPTTSFVGYSIPHPSEHVIHLRIPDEAGQVRLLRHVRGV